MTGTVDAAVVRFHEILGQQDGAVAVHQQLRDRQRAAGLMAGDRPFSHVLRPHFITSADHAQVCADGALVTAAIHRLVACALQPGEPGRLVRQYLALAPVERALAAQAPLTGSLSPLSRLDGFRGAGQTLFVEYNAHPPGGIISQDVLTEAHLDTRVMEEFQRDYTVRVVPGLPRLVDSLLDAWHTGGAPGGAPRVAIVDWEDGLQGEFRVLQAALRSQGVPAVVCTPDELCYEARRGLYVRDADGRRHPVTVVHRRVVLTDLLARYGDRDALTEHPMTRAWAAGACVMVNPFTSHLAHKKSVLALLTDPRTNCLLPASEATAASALVPWTRLVSEDTTTCPQGQDVDLLAYARARREHLVLKPNDDYGGRGVVCGWQTQDAAWQTALGRALEVPHVLQERVPIPVSPYPVLVDGTLRIDDYSETVDPYLYGTDSPGCMSRLSQTALLNVCSGGSLVPVLRIEARTPEIASAQGQLP
ncbi:hypothetical protein [Streptomyces sp. NPDC023327]|uniref:hypothetical protein n=1 Tax=Streptomyces sp. NPDC023327 TaxID=3157088 RepID=UPI0033F61DD4